MKKIISTLFLLTLMASPVASFARTTATSNTTAPTLTESQLKAKLLSLKKKQNRTKVNLKTNKAQVKVTIKKVKKARKIKKAKIIKAKTGTMVAPVTGKTN